MSMTEGQTNVSTLEEQLALEMEMLQAGINRYQSNTNKLIEKGIQSNTQHGRAVIAGVVNAVADGCLLYTSPSPRDGLLSRMPSSA